MAEDEHSASHNVASVAAPQTSRYSQNPAFQEVGNSGSNQQRTPTQSQTPQAPPRRSHPLGVVPLPPGSRGPRSLYLHRQENGFGFTLRHFIVYPPEDAADGDGLPQQPMDTIFVKRVAEDGAAARAGLRQGDRIVAVNGQLVAGVPYAQVVGLLKRSPPYLHLLVVPQQDDVLQRYFLETAHNPQTNQRPSSTGLVPPPETIEQQLQQLNAHLRRGTMLPQTSSPAPVASTPRVPPSLRQPHTPWSPLLSYSSPREASTYNEPANFHRNERENAYSRHSNPIYSRIDPSFHYDNDSLQNSLGVDIYNTPRDSLSCRSAGARVDDNISDIYSEPYVHDLYLRPRAQPQTPNRTGAQPQAPTNMRASLRRRASEGSTVSENSKENVSCGSGDYCSINSDSVARMTNTSGNTYSSGLSLPGDVQNAGQQGSQFSNIPGCRLSLDAGRRESTASLSSAAEGCKESMSSFDSTSTLTGHESDDSIVMMRFRKSFEKKEEFLRRPSQPTGWVTTPEEFKNPTSVTPKEFYGRPQKLQKPVWPPPNDSSNSLQESPSKSSKCASKLTNKNLQRVQIDLDSEREYLQSEKSDSHSSAEKELIFEDDYYLNGSGVPLQKSASGPIVRNQRDRNAFVTTLSRIHENIPSTGQSDKHIGMNGSTSLPNSPCLENQLYDENRYPPVVSRRARQFETGRLWPDDDSVPLNDRVMLYSSELARLTSKRVVPNVAVRAREFENRTEQLSQELHRERDLLRRITNRESRSLESGDMRLDTDNPPVQLRARSNSAESWSAAMQSSGVEPGGRTTGRVRALDWHAGPTYEERQRHRAVRQDSYLAAVRGPSANAVSDDQLRVIKRQSDLGEDDENVSTEMDTSPAKNQQSSVPIQNQNTKHITVNNTNNNINLTTPYPAITLHTALPTVSITLASPTKVNAVRPTHLALRDITEKTQHLLVPDDLLESPIIGDIDDLSPVSSEDVNLSSVVRRTKNNTNLIGEEERVMRRVSYLKATLGDQMFVDSDLELSDSEHQQQQILRSTYRRWRPPMFPDDIQQLRRLFEDPSISFFGNSSSSGGSAGPDHQRQESPVNAAGKENYRPVVKEGHLHCKVILQDRKKATDRSWKQVWAVLHGPHLYFYKDRSHYHQSPMGLTDVDTSVAPAVDMRYSLVDVADDYTKRKHVLRVQSTAGAELLLQAESPTDMACWVQALQQQSAEPDPDGLDQDGILGNKQQAVPQQVPAGTSIQVQGTTRLSPLPGHKSIRKLTSFRNRSPTGQSPVNKTRKPSDNLPSPKSKTWGRVVKQFRKIHQGSGSPSSPTVPEGATIGIPLEMCPSSTFSEYVPLLVEVCTKIVEEKGLDVIGIYRVPGNTAAITLLTDDVNKGFSTANLQDQRWNDVNVVSSLLKLFFRRLPDSLLTIELYPKFIEADKIEDNNSRLSVIRKLICELPDYHYETLKYLLYHLKRIVDHSEVNKMEARNLAIVFGPTLVRAGDDNMMKMVTDMSHQCRIVESLLCHVDWFFSEDDDGNFNLPPTANQEGVPVEMESATSAANHNLLLSNINKIEGMNKSSGSGKEVAKVIKSSIISAANRKIQRGNSKSRVGKSGLQKEDLVTTVKSKGNASINEITVKQTTENGKFSIKPETDLKIPTPVTEISYINQSNPQDDPLSQDTTDSSPRVNPIDGTIRTYAGLSATTKERIRRFELETKAMLAKRRLEETKRSDCVHSDENVSAERMSEISRRLQSNSNISSSDGNTTGNLYKPSNRPLTLSSIEDRLSARTLFFDPSYNNANRKIINSTNGSRALSQNLNSPNIYYTTNSNINNSSRISCQHELYENIPRDPRSRSSIAGTEQSYIPPSPNMLLRKAGSVESVSEMSAAAFGATKIPNYGIMKRFKTDKNEVPVKNENISSQNRFGSLDSLHGVNEPHRVSTDFSDDGSDLLTSLTTTFDRKLRSLLGPSPTPLTLNENIPYVDESPEKVVQNITEERIETLSTVSPQKIFRNPSLHKSKLTDKKGHEQFLDKTEKDVIEKEKDEDSSLFKDDRIPDNDRVVQENEKTDTVESCKSKIDASLNKSESLNAKTKRSENSNKSSVKRSDSLTKNEKTESNINKRRELSSGRKPLRDISTKLKRKNGMPERSIKRRHTVGGTKDFDKVPWLDNRLQNQVEGKESLNTSPDDRKEKSCLRTSSPDLSCSRRDRFLFEVSLLSPEGMILAVRQHLVGARPQSLPEAQVYKMPLESHV